MIDLNEYIFIQCPKCTKLDIIDRIKDDPYDAVTVGIICPNCDDGDFHEPVYYNNDGEVINAEG